MQQRAIMDGYDPQRRIGLIVDEWGTWHPPAPGQVPQFLWQQNTIRDALVAGLTLDVFNRHADKLVMANIAPLSTKPFDTLIYVNSKTSVIVIQLWGVIIVACEPSWGPLKRSLLRHINLHVSSMRC